MCHDNLNFRHIVLNIQNPIATMGPNYPSNVACVLNFHISYDFCYLLTKLPRWTTINDWKLILDFSFKAQIVLSHWRTSAKWRLRSPGQTQPTFDIIILCNNLISLLLLSFHLFLIRLQLRAAQLLKSQNRHPCIGQT